MRLLLFKSITMTYHAKQGHINKVQIIAHPNGGTGQESGEEVDVTVELQQRRLFGQTSHL